MITAPEVVRSLPDVNEFKIISFQIKVRFGGEAAHEPLAGGLGRLQLGLVDAALQDRQPLVQHRSQRLVLAHKVAIPQGDKVLFDVSRNNADT